jgi:acyl-coenzyme A thioesterase PaaI-like protein
MPLTGEFPPDETFRGRPVPEGWADTVAALRDLLDSFSASAPDADLVADAGKAFTELAGRFAAAGAPEEERIAGQAAGLPGRGQALVPLYTAEITGERLVGRVRFGPYYNGNGAVHGGSIPLVFDEVMGRLSLAGGRAPGRTAYLHVDYRSLTPVGRELQLAAEVTRTEGRKRFVRGTLHDGEVLCCEAEGLFVAPREH